VDNQGSDWDLSALRRHPSQSQRLTHVVNILWIDQFLSSSNAQAFVTPGRLSSP
jgi:hypothetical protein